jgi:hypothetical protein
MASRPIRVVAGFILISFRQLSLHCGSVDRQRMPHLIIPRMVSFRRLRHRYPSDCRVRGSPFFLSEFVLRKAESFFIINFSCHRIHGGDIRIRRNFGRGRRYRENSVLYIYCHLCRYADHRIGEENRDAALEGNYNVFYGLNLLCVSANFVTCEAIGAMLVTVLLNCPTGIRKAQVVFVSQYLYGDARSAASRSAKQISINPG